METISSPPPLTTSPPRFDYCFDLKLGESNVETYPEFSWKELVKEAEENKLLQKSAEGKPSIDPYASNDEDELKALAARLEKKYKTSAAAGKEKRRKRKAEDYIDRGAGYDESDPFIDNTEVYDELVPEDIQPVHGGFYINSGRLDFKDADVSDCDVDEEIEEQRKTSGRRLSKSAPVKKKAANIPPTNKVLMVKKRRTSNSDDPVPSKSKTNGTISKPSDSPRRSGSNSPVRPTGKPRVYTLSSHSDSSSSDSSGSSSSSSSDSEKEKKEKDKDIPVKLKAQLSTKSSPAPNPPAPSTTNQQPPQRRLKVKNVPLNPKLHGDSPKPVSAPSTPQAQSTVTNPKKSTPPSNREIFGSLLPNVSGVSIATGLSATSILSAPVRASSSQPNTPSVPSPKNKSVASSSPIPLKNKSPASSSPMPKPKIRRRVTDRLSNSANPSRKPSVIPMSPSIASPLKKRQKIDPPIASRPQPGTVVKKPRKPRVGAISSAPTPSSSMQRAPILTPEEHQQMVLQHLQLHPQLSSIGLGLSHLLLGSIPPPLPSSKPSTPKEKRKQKPQSKTIASDVLKSLATFQGQVGTGVTVSEVKKTKPHSLSPSTNIATSSPKSNTSPSRLSTPSPINIPRIPIPSSITVTASNIRSHAQRSSNTTSVASPTNSPNFQPPVINNKTYTDFHMNALLSKPFNGSSSSGK